MRICANRIPTNTKRSRCYLIKPDPNHRETKLIFEKHIRVARFRLTFRLNLHQIVDDISSDKSVFPGNPDILICGNCRDMFTDLQELLDHKKTYCKLRFTCKCHTLNGITDFSKFISSFTDKGDPNISLL